MMEKKDEKNPNMKKEYPKLYSEMKKLKLNDKVLDEILQIFDKWCKYCGDMNENGSCQCWNDE